MYIEKYYPLRRAWDIEKQRWIWIPIEKKDIIKEQGEK